MNIQNELGNLTLHEQLVGSESITIPVKLSGKIIQITFPAPIIWIDRVENANGILTPVISIMGNISSDGTIYSYKEMEIKK